MRPSRRHPLISIEVRPSLAAFLVELWRRHRRSGGATPAPAAAGLRARVLDQAAGQTKDVRPTYPPIAQSARVQGVVIIEATIGPTGKVQDARVLRSIPRC